MFLHAVSARGSPPIWAVLRTHCLRWAYSLRGAARPHRPRTLLYSRIKTRVPDRERHGNFVPKFITRSCCGPRDLTSLSRRLHLVDFFSAEFTRFITMSSAHTRTCILRCLLVWGRTCARARERGVLKEKGGCAKFFRHFIEIITFRDCGDASWKDEKHEHNTHNV